MKECVVGVIAMCEVVDKLKDINEKNSADKDEIDVAVLKFVEGFNRVMDYIMDGLDLGKEKYESILRIKYKTKFLKGIDSEFLISLRHKDYIYDLNTAAGRSEFYEKYKESLPILAYRLREEFGLTDIV